MGKHASKAVQQPDRQPHMRTPVGFMYNTYGINTCKYLTKWEDLTKDNLSLRWPKWGTSDLPKLVYLYTQLEKASYRIKQPEWEAFLIGTWKPQYEEIINGLTEWDKLKIISNGGKIRKKPHKPFLLPLPRPSSVSSPFPIPDLPALPPLTPEEKSLASKGENESSPR